MGLPGWSHPARASWEGRRLASRRPVAVCPLGAAGAVRAAGGARGLRTPTEAGHVLGGLVGGVPAPALGGPHLLQHNPLEHHPVHRVEPLPPSAPAHTRIDCLTRNGGDAHARQQGPTALGCRAPQDGHRAPPRCHKRGLPTVFRPVRRRSLPPNAGGRGMHLLVVTVAEVAAGGEVGEEVLLISGPLGAAPEPAAPARLVAVRLQDLLPVVVVPGRKPDRAVITSHNHCMLQQNRREFGPRLW